MLQILPFVCRGKSGHSIIVRDANFTNLHLSFPGDLDMDPVINYETHMDEAKLY